MKLCSVLCELIAVLCALLVDSLLGTTHPATYKNSHEPACIAPLPMPLFLHQCRILSIGFTSVCTHAGFTIVCTHADIQAPCTHAHIQAPCTQARAHKIPDLSPKSQIRSRNLKSDPRTSDINIHPHPRKHRLQKFKGRAVTAKRFQ